MLRRQAAARRWPRPEPGDRRFARQEWQREPVLRLPEAVLPARVALPRRTGRAAPSSTPRSKERLRFAVQAVVRRHVAGELRRDQSRRCCAQALETQRRKPHARAAPTCIADAQRRPHHARPTRRPSRSAATSRSRPGDVVYENDLIQLIQYRAGARARACAAARPLVMVPPCINKYYILDLQPENSFVRYAVEQGHTVFMVSWRNVGAGAGRLRPGTTTSRWACSRRFAGRAGDRAERPRQRARLLRRRHAARRRARRARARRARTRWRASPTSTTMLDFADTGTDRRVHRRGERRGARGRHRQGRHPARRGPRVVFSSLRANDLVWPYVVNNYLQGGTPAAFDLLYWNADSTNLPGPMYC